MTENDVFHKRIVIVGIFQMVLDIMSGRPNVRLGGKKRFSVKAEVNVL